MNSMGSSQSNHGATAGRKYDGGKLRYDLMPRRSLEGIVKVLTAGAAKYSPENWRKVDHALVRYYGSLLRHVEAWRAGEWIDEDTGEPHLACALCCLTFLLELGLDHGMMPEGTRDGTTWEKLAEAFASKSAPILTDVRIEVTQDFNATRVQTASEFIEKFGTPWRRPRFMIVGGANLRRARAR